MAAKKTSAKKPTAKKTSAKVRAKVIDIYKDRVDGVIHRVGDTIELTEARLAELAKGGFVEPDEQPANPPKSDEGASAPTDGSEGASAPEGE